MLAQVTFGKETFDDSSANYGLKAIRTRQFSRMPEAETQLWIAARDRVHGMERVGGLSVVDAVPGHDKERVGKWSTATYSLPEGMLLSIYGRRNLAALVASRHTEACLLLRVREGAPLVRISGNLTSDPRTPSSMVLFEGRADVTTPEEAKAEGMLIRERAHKYQPHNVQTLFVVDELAPGTAPRVAPRENVVTTAGGEVVRVRTSKPRRLLNI